MVLPEEPRNLIVGTVTSATISLSWEPISEADYYVVYWDWGNQQSDNLFNYASPLCQNGNFNGFPTEPLFTIGDLQSNIPTPSLNPSTTYLIRVASMNNVVQDVINSGNYNQTYESYWSYNLSLPTNIQFAVTVTTLDA